MKQTSIPSLTLDRNILENLEQLISRFKNEKSALLKSRKVVDAAVKGDLVYYGINTGFGALAKKKIDKSQLQQLQHNILLSHAVGLGDFLSRDICKLMLLIKIYGFWLGYSGVSERVFDRLVLFAEKDLIPAVPRKGSLGASGDLAPLAHMSLPLIGRGKFWDGLGEEVVPAADIMAHLGIEPIELAAKDGLALCNGTQMMSACGVHVVSRALGLIECADIAGAMSLEALHGSIRPFDERIHNARPHRGQRLVAGNLRRLLQGSKIIESHRDCDKVQDPYSLRCIPQVHGASRDALEYARGVVEIEINAATDNPLVFENGDILSGGNFHGQPLAYAFDFCAIALAELASIAERRIFLLLDGRDGLPELLMQDTGINSGFMIAQYTAAALVSENKTLCHPASVDSIPTSMGQEDHVSMGGNSALKLLEVLKNVEQVLAIEFLVASQALDYRKPTEPGEGVHSAHAFIRRYIPHREDDDLFRDYIERCVSVIQDSSLLRHVVDVVGPLS